MDINKTTPYDAGKIREIKQIIEVATTLSKSWFRGHPEEYENLTPKIFRSKYIQDIVVAPDTERNIIEHFKRIAPALTQNTPNQNDHCRWLFLMQHHGAPTRLLDWTENALVALYFAVENFSAGKDGELWAIYPHSLNEKGYKCRAIATQSNEHLQYLAREPHLAIAPLVVNHEKHQKLAKE